MEKKIKKLKGIIIDFMGVFVIATVLRCFIDREPVDMDLIASSIAVALGVVMGQFLCSRIKRTGIKSGLARSLIFMGLIIIVMCVYAAFVILWTAITGQIPNNIIGLPAGIVIGFLAALGILYLIKKMVHRFRKRKE